MSLQTRLEALVAAIGADIKALQASSGGGGSSVPFDPHYATVPVPGTLYFPNQGANVTFTPTVSRLYYMPFTVARTVSLTSWQVEVTTVASNAVLRSSIYSSAANFQPGPKLVDAAATAVGTSTGWKSFAPASALTLQPDTLYWFGVVAQTAAPVLRSRNATDPFVVDNSNAPTLLLTSAYYQSSITGSTPATPATGMSVSGGPVVAAQFS